jgi:hypothetical protein
MKVTRNKVLLYASGIVFVFGAATVFRHAAVRFNERQILFQGCESPAKHQEGYQTVKIFDAVGNNESGEVTLYNSADQPFLRDGWTIEEAALWATTDVTSLGSAHNLIIQRTAPKALDGCPTSQDAEILSVPTPRFWQDEARNWTHGQECTVILRVKLDSAGGVTDVEKGPDHYHNCAEIDQIVEAARQIRFRPATRNGDLIAQRVSILYRTH